MKQFDLDKAMSGAPLVTRDGRPATEFRLRAREDLFSYEAQVDGRSHSYTCRGTFWISSKDPLDLFLAEEAEA